MFDSLLQHQIWVASSEVEQGAFNLLVTGSNPVPPTKLFYIAGYNQMVDGQPHKLSDEGSSPSPATMFGF